MSAVPADPFASPTFEFGLGFQSAAERVKGEEEERKALVKRELRYHVPFFDDCLRGILPNDLVILGAKSGVGKTELVVSIALANVRVGKTVHVFALEAADKEIERRIKFRLLAELALRAGRSIAGLNYPDWWRGNCEDIVGPYNAQAEKAMEKIAGLKTYYRSSVFGPDQLRKLMLAVQTETDLIVIDHLHYVDLDDENENRAYKALVKATRDVALGMGRPVILVVHLKKSDARDRSLVPDLEQVHGSSDIFKVATHSIMLAPAKGLPDGARNLGNTFMSVPKDRMGGRTGVIALCRFDKHTNSYDGTYTLGYERGDTFEALDTTDVPRWAKRHRPLFGASHAALGGA